MLRLVAAVVGRQRRPEFLPCGSARLELGRSPRLADLLGGDLVVRSASHTCSVGTWLFALPRRLARRGFDHMPLLADLLGEDLVGKWAKERFVDLALGTSLLGTRQQPSSLCATTWSRSEAFLLGVKNPECAQAHQYGVALE